jgi:hypothetical protein
MKKIEPILLGKDILLFKNVLENPKEVYDFVLKTKTENDVNFGEWSKWGNIGSYSKAYPQNSNEWKSLSNQSSILVKECIDIFFQALKIYKESYMNEEYFNMHEYPLNFPTSYEDLDANNPERYSISDLPIFEIPTTQAGKNKSMDIHLDRQFWYQGGPRHVFNFNIYINDDYEGGEIFFIDVENAERKIYVDSTGNHIEYLLADEPLTYRMEAGDAMLFRTDVYHGVKPTIGNKFYFRQFLDAPETLEIQNITKNMSNEDLEKFKKNCEVEGKSKMFTPVLFDSLEDIDVDSYKDWPGIKMPILIKK